MLVREEVANHVCFVVDDAGAARAPGADPHAFVRDGSAHRYPSVLVVWQCGEDPMIVAVHSYLDVKLTAEEAEEIASDYLQEVDWFHGEPRPADFVLD